MGFGNRQWLKSTPHKAKHSKLECSGWLVQANDTTIP